MTPRSTPQPWTVDYDWLWDPSVHDPVATLRATLHHPHAQELSQAFCQALPQDVHGVAGAGGWAVYPQPHHSSDVAVLDLTAGGEDLADALQDAADRLYQAVRAADGLEIVWEQLPLTDGTASRSGSPTRRAR
ncbi:hypothetical protein [Actinomyces faecalis]|uniref:hypothetical protein n=1 Tax=Actinomyces faecalis TaxID=2722820 RepID=UPI00155437C1|nr:hypothetical protein [Actinomyces faecalis]